MLSYLEDLLSLVFPEICNACGKSLYKDESLICNYCKVKLPYTNFHLQVENPIEKVFWGRVPIEKALRGEKIIAPEDVLKLLLYKGKIYIQKLDRIIPLLYDTVNLSDDINKRIEEYPSSIDTETLKAAIDGGFLAPNEFTKTIINVGGYGFLDD